MSRKTAELILPCQVCREYAIVGYEATEETRENIWSCPTCGEPNRVQLKGRVTDVLRRNL